MKIVNMRIGTVLAVLAWASVAFSAESIVAVVNGSPITERDVAEAVNRIIPQATFHGNISADRLAEFRDAALDQLITLELQYQHARKIGIKPDRAAVRERMKQLRESFPTDQEYTTWLKRSGRTEDEVRSRIEKEALVKSAREKILVGPSHLDDKAVREYYDKNAEKFLQPSSFRLRIISTKSEEKAKEALAQIARGSDFGDVAARMSEDNYRIKGGDIGYVHRGRIYPALEDAADKLKPGETSGLIASEGMWFVIRVEDKMPEKQLSFEEVKEKLKKDLENKRMSELESRWVEELKAKAVIEIKPASQEDSAKTK